MFSQGYDLGHADLAIGKACSSLAERCLNMAEEGVRFLPCLPATSPDAILPTMFTVSEEDAAAIRTTFEKKGAIMAQTASVGGRGERHDRGADANRSERG